MDFSAAQRYCKSTSDPASSDTKSTIDVFLAVESSCSPRIPPDADFKRDAGYCVGSGRDVSG